MTARADVDQAISANYRIVVRAMDRLILPKLIGLGITMAQFKALLAVSAAGERGIAVTELGVELSIGQPSASLIVDQLAKRGYVVRRPDEADRRRVLVGATPAGEELVAELRQGRRSTFLEWVGKMSDQDAAALAVGIHALAKVVTAADWETASGGELENR